MKMQRYIHCLIVAGVAIGLMNTGVIAEDNPAQTSGATSVQFISFKNYPDHTFNVREYIQGMKKGGA